jgi:hypothetical protein
MGVEILIIDVHCSGATMANVREANSQINCTSPGNFLNSDVYSQMRPLKQPIDIPQNNFSHLDGS